MHEGELISLVVVASLGCVWMGLVWLVLRRLPPPAPRLPQPGTASGRILLLRSRLRGVEEPLVPGRLSFTDAAPDAGRLSREAGAGRLSVA